MNCSKENKKLIGRINRIKGQVDSIRDKLVDDLECNKTEDAYEVIRQLSTIKGAINSIIHSYIEHFAKEHLVTQIQEAKDIDDATDKMDALLEILKSYGK